ncbi:hypothetical protein HK098_005032 [Nowakowskiella sp. JEL0407]|nr:hypothetical protein HK098_005032 [Nowakowskiella sp. JEL0407]
MIQPVRELHPQKTASYRHALLLFHGISLGALLSPLSPISPFVGINTAKRKLNSASNKVKCDDLIDGSLVQLIDNSKTLNTANLSPPEPEVSHSFIENSKSRSKISVSDLLDELSMYASQNLLTRCESLFEEILSLTARLRNKINEKYHIRACNTMILFYSAHSIQKSFAIYDRMIFENWTPDFSTFEALIKACAKAGNFDGMLNCVEVMATKGMTLNLDLYRFIIITLYNSKRFDDVIDQFRSLQNDGCNFDKYTLHTALRAFIALEKVSEAEDLLIKLVEGKKFQSSHYSFHIVIEGWGKIGDVDRARLLLWRMSQLGCPPTRYSIRVLLQSYARNNESIDPSTLIEFETNYEQYYLNETLAAVSKYGGIDQANDTYSSMKSNGISIETVGGNSYLSRLLGEEGYDAKTVISELINNGHDTKDRYFTGHLLKYFFKQKGLEGMQQTELLLRNTGSEFTDITNIQILNAHRSSNPVAIYEKFRKLFLNSTPTLKACNILLNSYTDVGDLFSVLAVYYLIRHHWNLIPDEYTFGAIFRCCKKINAPISFLFRPLRVDMKMYNIQPSKLMYQAQLEAIAYHGEIQDLNDLLEEMSYRRFPLDRIHYITIFNALKRHKQPEAIRNYIEVFHKQGEIKVDADMVTVLIRAHGEDVSGAKNAFEDALFKWNVQLTPVMLAEISKAFASKGLNYDLFEYIRKLEATQVQIHDPITESKEGDIKLTLTDRSLRFMFDTFNTINDALQFMIQNQRRLGNLLDITFFNAGISRIARIRGEYLAQFHSNTFGYNKIRMRAEYTPTEMRKIASFILQMIPSGVKPNVSTFTSLAIMCTDKTGTSPFKLEPKHSYNDDCKFFRKMRLIMVNEYNLEPDWVFLRLFVAAAVRAGVERSIMDIWKEYVMVPLSYRRRRRRGWRFGNRVAWFDPQGKYAMNPENVLLVLDGFCKVGRSDVALKCWEKLKQTRYYIPELYESCSLYEIVLKKMSGVRISKSKKFENRLLKDNI